mmetsp:Transcript_2416/g.4884  ORF Transcript_2416/g.4884 Transcript_2416/m.4884 type:complete len:128 (+) Transcript_2416:466-849(+)
MAVLSSLKQRLHSQVATLGKAVDTAVEGREAKMAAAKAKEHATEEKEEERAHEARAMQESLAALRRKARRAVERGDESSRDKRVETIEGVKRKADEELDGLLSKVDRAIARKEWKRSLVTDPQLNHS